MLGVPVNTTVLPIQSGFVPVVKSRLTAGVKLGFTVMVMVFEVAVVEVKQDPPDTVTSHVTKSPFVIAEEV